MLRRSSLALVYEVTSLCKILVGSPIDHALHSGVEGWLTAADDGWRRQTCYGREAMS